MLKRRLIPKLQILNHDFGRVKKMVLVTTQRFEDPVVIGDPVSQAKIYESQAADELIFVSIRDDDSAREELLKILDKTCKQIFMPITIGGGVKSLEDIKLFLDHGADKVALNTAFLERPTLIEEAVDKFGSSNIVASIDYRQTGDKNHVYSHNGTVNTGLEVLDWVLEVEKRGVGEIMLTSIDRDGTREGLDIDTIKKVNDALTIPLIAGGGCGYNQHFVDAYLETGVSGISAGSYFCYKDENPMQTRGQIYNAGIPIRLQT